MHSNDHLQVLHVTEETEVELSGIDVSIGRYKKRIQSISFQMEISICNKGVVENNKGNSLYFFSTRIKKSREPARVSNDRVTTAKNKK